MKARLFLNIVVLFLIIASLHVSLTSIGQGLIIPVGSYFSVPSGNYIRLTGADSLTIQSSASGTGSLICNGTFTGPAKVERYMTGAKWHIVASPVTGQSFTNFVTNGANNIPWLSGTTPVQYGIMEYDEVNDKWSTPFTASQSGNFVTSQGYSVRNRADGKITFKGNIITTNQTVSLTRGKYGWNCIGNPFTSVIQVKGLGGILADNIDNLDANYAGIYVWDEQPNYNNSGLKKDYRVHCNTPYSFPYTIQEESSTYIPVGQGFFMKSKTGGGTFTFKQSMKTHQTGVAFRSAGTEWPAIRLQVSGNNLVSTTVVAFNSQMNKGLDPSFDVGMLKGNPAFAVYTRLAANDGLDYAVQALPDSSFEKEVIPIGLDCTVGTTVTFKLEKARFPEECEITLEDKTNGTFKTFTVDTAQYVAKIESNTKGVGRFYLHINRIGAGVDKPNASNCLIYSSNNRIVVRSDFNENSSISIYHTDGKLVSNSTYNLRNSYQSKVLDKGIYIVKVSTTRGVYSRRILL